MPQTFPGKGLHTLHCTRFFSPALFATHFPAGNGLTGLMRGGLTGGLGGCPFLVHLPGLFPLPGLYTHGPIDWHTFRKNP